MHFASRFSKIAQEVIKNYYQEFAGSLQNNSHSKALIYSQKVERLRVNFLDYLGISNSHLVSIQPNNHYLEKIILNFLTLELKKWDIFTNCLESQLKATFAYPLQEFLNRREEIKPAFIYIEGKDIDQSLVEGIYRKINYLRGEGQLIYSYFACKDLEGLKKQPLKDFSFISYNPSGELFEFGSVLFGFHKELELKPVFLGSGGAKFNHQSSEIELRNLPYLLEIGTQNLISCLVLSEYFEKLLEN